MATQTIRSHSVDKGKPVPKAAPVVKAGNGSAGSGTHAGPVVHTRTITPELAATYLARNVSNRRVRDRHVDLFARQMTEGRWMLNAEAVKFDWDGNLLDGQHRLLACIKADKPFTTYVVTGLSPGVFKTIDTGARRMCSDALLMMGEINTAVLGAALVHLWRHTTGRTFSTKGGGGNSATTSELLEVLEEHPGLRESLRQSYHKPALITPSLVGFLHYIFAQKDKAKADEFFEKLRAGTDMGVQNPIFVLREKLIRNAAQPKQKYVSRDVAAFTIKAWNAWRDNRRITTLVMRPGDAFPEVK